MRLASYTMQCERLTLKVERREISYVRNTLESYDGMALVHTIDSATALIQVYVAPGCRDMVYSILESLRREGVSIFLTAEAKN